MYYYLLLINLYYIQYVYFLYLFNSFKYFLYIYKIENIYQKNINHNIKIINITIIIYLYKFIYIK